jgi:predicted acetyltransferase
MDLEIRTVRPDELEAFARALESAFSAELNPAEFEHERPVMASERTHAAFEGGAIVGGASAAGFRMAVPGGGSVAAAGITGVGVLPSHRRRGINTALMRAQLDDIHDRGEPVAALHASEGGIYGRFGYGLASFTGHMEVDADRTSFVRGYRPSGRVRLVVRDEALGPMRAIYDAVVPTWPGMLALDDLWWTWRWTDPDRHGDGTAFYALHESEDGVTDAYAAYRVKHEWPDGMPRLELSVRDLQATSPQAYADIWRFLFDIDLVGRVSSWNRPVDDPLLHLVAEPRRLRFSLRDGLWVRPVDVPAALSARGYRGHGRIILEVRDDFCPWNDGRFALEVENGAATCTAAADEGDPDLRCTVNDVGAVYLGGTRFGELHRAGRVSEVVPGAIARADALFACDRAPWCSLMF